MSENQLGPAALHAGAAQVEITPEFGIHLEGNIGVYRPALFVNDPIYAKALVLESGGRKVCILSLDLLAINAEWASEIRRRAAEEFGFEPSAVMVHDTQTHSAPTLGHWGFEDSEYAKNMPWWANAGDERYSEFAVTRILEAIRKAHAALEPAMIGAASGVDGRVAFNRRYIMRDGMVRTNAAVADPLIRSVEGPADPEVGVVCINRRNLHPIAMLLHHTCHPTHLLGASPNAVSADWPGAWGDEVKARYGQSIVPLVINGCCGNVLHRNPLDPTWQSDFRRMGRLLADTTGDVMKRITYSQEIVLDYKSVVLDIPLRELSEADAESARKLLAEHPEPMWLDDTHTRIHWDWIYAIGQLLLYRNRKRDPYYHYEIQVLRLGEIALLAVPGEPFVEAQLAIKHKSPTFPTYVVHHSNAYVGYVPTKEAFARGGYETRTGMGSRLVPEALEMIVERSAQLLHEVYASVKESKP